MKIIEQSHQILTMDTIKNLEVAGRTCYQSQDKITLDSAEKFADMLVRKGHHAMVEFGDIIVRFITNRGVTHELVRHRHCSFAQESTRYVKYDGEMEFIKPVWCSDYLSEIVNTGEDINVLPMDERIWASAMAREEVNYKSLLKCGWKVQQAREVLPNSLKTEIVVKANFREWMHILTLRTAKASHPQMVSLMKPLLKELQEKIPVVFDNI